MSFIISIQGGMAAGKTTLTKYLEAHVKNIKVSYENPTATINEVKRLGLNKFKLEDYVKIQRLFINAEIERYNSLKAFDKAIIDLGPEEIEFYTLHFPKTINEEWDIEILLKDELTELRKCKLDGVLYLDASPEVLLSRKEKDKTRERGFFEHYINGLYTYKRLWFSSYDYTTFLNVDNISADEVGEFAVKWIEKL